MHSANIKLRTSRLLLQPLARDDAADVFAYASDPAVAEYTSWSAHRSIADASAFIERTLSSAAKDPDHVRLPLASRIIGHQAVCGTIGFFQDTTITAHVDYAISRSHWDNGYMTKAVSAVVGWAFTAIPTLDTVDSHCLALNGASKRVLEKCGFERVGIEAVQFGEKFDHQVLPVSHYRCSRTSFPLGQRPTTACG